MEPLVNQIYAFAATLVIGAIAGFCYDYYLVVRGVFKLKKVGTCLGDIIFWLFTTTLVFTLLILGNWGVVRLYVFIGLGLGALLYFQSLSVVMRRLVRFKFYLLYEIWKLIVRIALFFWKIIIFPVRLLFLILSYPLNLLRVIFNKTGSRLKGIFYNLLGKRVERGIIRLKAKLSALAFWKKRKDD
ncbi:MAG: Spore cortex protein YabQ (Spore_YabQ) [Pelotomaculum sp. PtaB.Bin013]|uniref:Spore cortex biosynthesis protein YabQ n=1 Tax=Pelotomaculum isophthalicicum JI TaxID=947010 RepID=A0A9X4JWG8_9FIRM|nr:spore cortex biosynthesis protein YabQ [Pelotomaculum isophthalicicum]MDF9409222.1 spore cortex biosynthesis protein YabQ [Pelotomaculum isophthalicicum JI]OPX81832.1 MAG: Spore cortex protein YabQ (Spore_YabQ) [Pelotomaculum sp. PtaB.Bin013]